MYDELVKVLRKYSCPEYSDGCGMCPSFKDGCAVRAIQQTADAIEKLTAYVALYKDGGETAMKVAQEYKAAYIAEHDARIAESKPRWIPVTERLPEKFENVIVANKRGKHYDIDKAWWNGSYFDRCAKGSYSNVTHWMPLPQEPKEE